MADVQQHIAELRDGLVRFADADQFLQAYGQGIARGILTVKSTETLTPLQPFSVQFEVGTRRARDAAQVQLVNQRGELCMLQLVGDNSALLKAMKVLAEMLSKQQQAQVQASAVPQVEELSPKDNEKTKQVPDSIDFSLDLSARESELSDQIELERQGDAAVDNENNKSVEMLRAYIAAESAKNEILSNRVETVATKPDHDTPLVSEQTSQTLQTSPSPSPSPSENPPIVQQAMPPFLAGDLLTFADAASAAVVLDEVKKTGGLMAQCPEKRSYGPVRIRILIVGGGGTAPLKAELVFAQDGKAALVFADPLAFCQILQDKLGTMPGPAVIAVSKNIQAQDATVNTEIAENTDLFSSAVPEAQISAALGAGPMLSPRTSTTRIFRQLTLQDQVFAMPESPADFMNYDLIKPPDPRKVSKHNLPELLMSLSGNRISGTLLLTAKKIRIEVVLRSGAMLLSNEERVQLLELATVEQGQMQLAPRLPERIPAAKKPRDPRGLVGEMLRKQLAKQRTSDLELGLASLGERFPVPAPRVSPVMYGLKLDAKEERFLDLVLDGSRPLSEIPRVAGMLRPATFRFIYILIIYRLIEFRFEAILDPSADPKLLFKKECEKLLVAGPFEVLGVHWSEHPQLIQQSFIKRSQRFMPTSTSAKLNPELAKKVLHKMEQAAELLKNKHARVAERKALGNIDIKSAAGILVRHAELASIREDFETVRLSMEMAVELHPSQEFREKWKRLQMRKNDKLVVHD